VAKIKNRISRRESAISAVESLLDQKDLSSKFLLGLKFFAMVLAFLIAAYGQSRFDKLDPLYINEGIFLYLVAGALLFWAFRRDEEVDTVSLIPSLTVRQEAAVVGVIFLVAAFFRFWKINSIPPGVYYDEALNGLLAVDINGGARNVYLRPVLQPAYYSYFEALFIHLFGISNWSTRALPVLFGLITILPFYFLLRFTMGLPMAIIGTWLLAVCRWHIHISRLNFNIVQAPLVLALSLYFLYKAFRTVTPLRARWLYILAGFCIGLSFHVYICMQIFPLAALLILLSHLLTDPLHARRFAREWATGLLAFGVVITPVFYSIYTQNTEFIRQGYLNHNFATTWGNIKASLLMFNSIGDYNWRHNFNRYPHFDALTGMLFALGTIYLVFDLVAFMVELPQKGRAALTSGRLFNFGMLACFVILMTPSVVTGGDHPHLLRTTGTLLPALFAAALAVDKSSKLTLALFGEKVRKALLLIVALVLSCAAILNYNVYFREYANSRDVWSAFLSPQRASAEYILSTKPYSLLYETGLDNATFKFLTLNKVQTKTFDLSMDLPVREIPGGDLLYLLDASQFESRIPVFQLWYPKGTVDFVKDPWGGHYYFAYRVTRDETLSRMGLTAMVSAGGKKMTIDQVDPNGDWSGAIEAASFNYDLKGSLFVREVGGIEYQLALKSDLPARLTLDGRTWSSAQKLPLKIKLTPGWHSIGISGTGRKGMKVSVMDALPGQSLAPVPVYLFCPKLPQGLDSPGIKKLLL